MELSRGIKRQIKKSGKTISQIAENLHVARETLSSQINGNPSYFTLVKIANAIGCEVADFLVDNNSSNNAVCPHCGKPIRLKIEIPEE